MFLWEIHLQKGGCSIANVSLPECTWFCGFLRDKKPSQADFVQNMCIELMYCKTNSPKSEILSWGQIFRKMSMSFKSFVINDSFVILGRFHPFTHESNSKFAPENRPNPKRKISSSNNWFSGAMLDMIVSGRVKHFDASKTFNNHLIVLSIVCVCVWSLNDLGWTWETKSYKIHTKWENYVYIYIYKYIYIYPHPTFSNTSTLSVSKKPHGSPAPLMATAMNGKEGCAAQRAEGCCLQGPLLRSVLRIPQLRAKLSESEQPLRPHYQPIFTLEVRLPRNIFLHQVHLMRHLTLDIWM